MKAVILMMGGVIPPGRGNGFHSSANWFIPKTFHERYGVAPVTITLATELPEMLPKERLK